MSEQKRLEKHRKYNLSVKGQARYKRYEDKHPERRERWSPIMALRARGSAKWDTNPEFENGVLSYFRIAKREAKQCREVMCV